MDKLIAKNKSANFNYEILEKYQAGIVLTGGEIKSIRAGNVNLTNSYIVFKEDEAWIINMHIAKYMNVAEDELRTRKLLLHKKEIIRLKHEVETKRLVLIPIAITFNNRSKVKIDFSTAKGKTKGDKKETIKRRETERMINRKLKTYINK